MIDMEVNKFQIGDKVKIIDGLTSKDTIDEIPQDELDAIYNGKINLTVGEYTIYNEIYCEDTEQQLGYYFYENQLKSIYINSSHEILNQLIDMRIHEYLNKPLDVKIKYHDSNMPKLEKITKGNWIDCRVVEGGKVTYDIGTPNERKESLKWEETTKRDQKGNIYKTKVIKYKKGDFMMLPLGISLNQGNGYEVNLVPRSSTFKNFHIIQTNHYGVGDDTFVGNNDMYHFPCLALADGEIELYERVCQMRINKAMGEVNFDEVEDMEGEDRNGFGSTGTK